MIQRVVILFPLALMLLGSPAWAAGEAQGLYFWATLGSALALGAAGFVAAAGRLEFGLLVSVFVLGSAGRLSLLRDQWFPSIELLPLTFPVVGGIAAIALQALVTTAILWRHRALVLAFLSRPAMATRSLFVIAMLAVLSVSPTLFVAYGSFVSWTAHVMLGGALAGLQVATLAALLLTPTPALPRISGTLTAITAAAIVLVASALLAFFAFEGAPHVGDDLAYLFQAKTFAGGHLTVPAPPAEIRPGLEYYLLDIRDDRWIATTAPGWPALLALGEHVGLPWLVNPVVSALSVLLAFRLVCRATADERLASLVAWLMACSPWVLGSGGSLMTHPTALFCLLLAWLCLVEGGGVRKNPSAPLSLSWALAAGLSMGWLFTTRQLEGVVLGGVTGLTLLTLRPMPWRAIIAYGVGCLSTGLVYFAYNFALTGDPLDAPLASYLEKTWPDTRNAFGFGPDLGPPPGSWGALDFWPGHSLVEGAVNSLNGFASLNLELFGWSMGSLFAAALLLFARPGRRSLPGARFLTVCFVTIVSTLAFYWFAGTFYVGPRYWYIVSFPVLVASAAGILAVCDRLEVVYAQRVPMVVLLLCLTGLLIFTPWRGATKYYQFRENYNWLAAEDFGNDLVFVAVDGAVEAALALNDPYLSADRPIFLRDLGRDANNRAAAAYPDRTPRLVRLDQDGWTPLAWADSMESGQ